MASKRNINDLKKCLEISTANHDPLGIANNNERLGDAYVSSGKYETATEYYEKSLEMYSEIGHFSAKIKSNLKLANTHYKLAQYQTAIEYSKSSLEISTTFGEPSGIPVAIVSWVAFTVALGSIKKQLTVLKKVSK